MSNDTDPQRTNPKIGTILLTILIVGAIVGAFVWVAVENNRRDQKRFEAETRMYEMRDRGNDWLRRNSR